MTLRRGFSLIEIMVVMALIAAALLTVPALFSSLIGRNLTEESAKLVRRVHAVYNKSMITGQTYRIVFEMKVDKQTNKTTNTYFVESSKEDARADQSSHEEEVGLWADRDKEEKAKKEKYVKKPNFVPVKDENWGKPHEFSKDVRLYGVWIEGMKERTREGTAYLYFSPMGYTQRAQITLAGDTQGKSLKVIRTEPLTGEVSVDNEESPL